MENSHLLYVNLLQILLTILDIIFQTTRIAQCLPINEDNELVNTLVMVHCMVYIFSVYITPPPPPPPKMTLWGGGGEAEGIFNVRIKWNDVSMSE